MLPKLIITLTDLSCVIVLAFFSLACLYLIISPETGLMDYIYALSSDWISLSLLLSCLGYYFFCAFILKASAGRILYRKLL